MGSRRSDFTRYYFHLARFFVITRNFTFSALLPCLTIFALAASPDTAQAQQCTDATSTLPGALRNINVIDSNPVFGLDERRLTATLDGETFIFIRDFATLEADDAISAGNVILGISEPDILNNGSFYLNVARISTPG